MIWQDISMVMLRRTSKVAVVVYFKVLSQHSPVEIEREMRDTVQRNWKFN
jgi:hypothetical protein